MTKPASFVCQHCGAESFNPNDIRERYCGRCHAFVDDPPAIRPRPLSDPCAICGRPWRQCECGEPLDAYRDDRFAERGCDRCGKAYRGPAIYCSLECALADA
jgi:hypothetical protein